MPLKFRVVLLLVSVAIASHAAIPAGAQLPPRFYARLVASGLEAPTAMQFAPDGRLFITLQGGAIRIVKDGQLLAEPFVQLPVHASGSAGLLGLAFDPSFETSPYVYVYYTTATLPRHNRISRITADGDRAVPQSEVVVFELDVQESGGHNGGALHFGPDGLLYAAVGENHNGANSQTLDNLFGKILRLNSDGTIPLDNPFAEITTGRNQAIWALGLRNPFTFAFDPVTGRMFINDVGQSTWEEINEGVAGANYGWPTSEGPTSNPEITSPLHVYGHGASSDTGCAITGGTFYPSHPSAPSTLLGRYVFADYCGGWIRHLDPMEPSTSTLFATGISGPVDLKVGPDGALYYLARGNTGAVFSIHEATAGERVLAVTLEGTGRGRVTSDRGALDCPVGSCSDAFAPGVTVRLAAEPSPGSVFAGWNGACAGQSVCTVTMSADRDVAAVFDSQHDLQVTALSTGTTTVRPGATLAVTDTTANTGSAGVPSTTTRYYLSNDTVQSPDAVRVQKTHVVPALPGGGSHAATTTVTIPAQLAPGAYWLLACADDLGRVAEFDEANNCASYGPLSVARPDLVVTSFTAPPPTAAPGSTFALTDTVRNAGPVRAPASTTRFYLSRNAIKDAADVRMAVTRSVPALEPNATSSGKKNLKVPAGIALGAYFVLVCADDKNAVVESNEANNCLASSTTIDVQLPDLAATAVQASVPRVAPGRPLNVSSTTRNEGRSGAPSSKTRYRLSTDGVVDAGDALLAGTTNVAALAPGASKSFTTRVTIPASTPPGSYFIIACADANSAVAESNEDNNCVVTATPLIVDGP